MDLITLRRKLDAIPIDAAQLRLVSNNQLGNFLAFKNAVNQLALVPPLARFAQEVQSSPVFQMATDQFVTDPTGLIQIKQRADALFGAVTILKQILDETTPKLPPETIILTIPPQKDLSTTTGYLEEFAKSLTPLVFEEGIGGKIEVIHWESGSLLVFIFLGTMTAVGIVARAVSAAAIAYQEIQKGRATAQHVDLLKEHVRESKMKNDLAAVIAEAQKERIKDVVEKESRAAELEIFGESQNERLERIKHSVRGLAELFEKGATISPALDMPQEQQAKFPDVEHLLTATPPIKQLEGAKPANETNPHPAATSEQ
jgi:hypothetical protein